MARPQLSSLTPIALGIALAFGLDPAVAQVVASHGGPQVTAAQNGVPVINIVAPNSSGVSHNLYSQFNVGSSGVVLNNATAAVVTQLGGAIAANPTLGATPAHLILNEVVQSNPATLDGFVEVGGAPAEVVIADPAGITCGGCGFLNTPRVTLTTGTPNLSAAGALTGFTVTGGTLTVDGAGLDGSRQAIFDLLARGIVVNGQVNAQDLQLIGGAETFDYGSRTATPLAGGSGAPQFAIDSSALGGMYADRIRLIATEAGVGVRVLGDAAASASDLDITAAGQIVLSGRLSAAGNLAVVYDGSAAAPNAISVAGSATQSTLAAADNLTLTGGAGSVSLSGSTLGAGQDLSISGANVSDVGGSNAVRFAEGAVTVSAPGGAINARAADYNGATGLSMSSSTLDLGTGAILTSATGGTSSGAVSLTTLQGLTIDATVAGTQVALEAGTLINGGTVQGTTGTTLVASSFDNQAGAKLIGSTASGPTTISAVTLQNDGVLQSGGTLAVTQQTGAGRLTNTGSILGTGDVTVAIAAPTFTNAGTIQSAGNLNLNFSGALTNGASTGPGTASGALIGNVVNLAPASLNNLGVIQGTTAVNLTTSSVTNQATGLIATATAGTTPSTLSAGTWTNDGSIFATAPLTLNVGTSLNNDATGAIVGTNVSITGTSPSAALTNHGGGLIFGATTLAISGFNSITNDLTWITNPNPTPTEAEVAEIGEIQSSGTVALTASGTLTNRGFIDGDEGVTITAGQFINQTREPGMGATSTGYVYVPGSAQYTLNFGNNYSQIVAIAPELQYQELSPVNQTLQFGINVAVGYGTAVAQPAPNLDALFFQVLPDYLVQTSPNYQVNPKYYAEFNQPSDWYRMWTGYAFQVQSGAGSYDSTPVQAHVLSASGPVTIDIGSASSNTGGIIAGAQNVTIGLRPGAPVGTVFTNNTIDYAVNVYTANGIEEWAPASPFTTTPYSMEIEGANNFGYVLVNPMVAVEPLSFVATQQATLIGATIQSGMTFSAQNVTLINSTSSSSTTSPATASSNVTSTLSGANSKTIVPGTPAALSVPLSLGGLTLLLPTNPNGLYVIDQNPNAPYLIETNPRYTSLLSPGLGSDYLINALGLNPSTTEERLGDADYEDYLIQQELIDQTGLALIDGATDQTGEIQSLMNNAVWEAHSLNLSLGVALTQAQINSLQQDMVWLVSTTVDGHQVLAPVVYLANPTRAGLSTTSTITAANIAVAGGNSFQNTGGTVSATQNLSIQTTGDIANTGGTVSGGSVALTTSGGDISNTSVINRYGDSANYRDLVNNQASISSTGDLALTSTQGNITSTGGNLSAGGNAALNAGGNVTLQNQTLQSQTTKTTSSGNWLTGEHSTTVVTTTQSSNGSNLTTGGNLTINAGNDLNVTGSQVVAKGDLTVGASDINVTNATTTNTQSVSTSSSGWSSSGPLSFGYSSNSGNTNTTQTQVVASTLASGGDMTLNGRNSVTVTGSDVGSGGNLTVNTKTLTTNAAANTTDTTSSSSGWGVGVSLSADSNNEALGISGGENHASGSADSSTARVSTLSSGGNMNLNVQGGTINAQGTQVFAGGNFNQTANQINYTAATNTNSASSASSGMQFGISSGANYNVGTAASQAGSLQVPGVGLPSVMASAGGSYTQSNSNSTGTTNTVATITARGNVNSTSTADTNLQGIQIQAGNAANLSAGTLNVTAAYDSSNSTSSSYTASGGVQGGFDVTGKPVGGAEGSYGSSNGSGSSTTANVASISSNTGTTITTTGDANFEGTQLASGGATTIAAGGNVNFTQATNTSSSSSSSQGYAGSVGMDQSGAGSNKQFSASAGQSNASGSSTTAVVGSITSQGGITVSAGKTSDVTLQGTQLATPGAINVSAGRDVNLTAATSTSQSNSSSWSASLSAQGGDKAEKGKAGSTGGSNFNASASYASGSSNVVQQEGGTLDGRSISISAGRDTNMTGTQVEASSVAINTGRDLNMQSAQTTSSSSAASYGGSLGVTGSKTSQDASGATTDQQGTAANAGFNYGTSGANSVSNENAHVGGGNVSISTGRDMNLAGANVTGGTVGVNVGGNLTVTTQTDQSSSSSTNASGYVGYSGTSGAGRKGQFGGDLRDGVAGSGGSDSSSSVSVGQASGIVGGTTTVNVLTGTTTLAGATIGSTAGNTQLNTAHLQSSDVALSSSQSGVQVGAGLTPYQAALPGIAHDNKPSTAGTVSSNIGGEPIVGNVRVSAVTNALAQPSVQSALLLQRGLKAAQASYGNTLPPAAVVQALTAAGVSVPAHASPATLASLVSATLANGSAALRKSLTQSAVPQSQVDSLAQTLSMNP